MRRRTLLLLTAFIFPMVLLAPPPVSRADAPPAAAVTSTLQGEVEQLLKEGTAAYQKGDFPAAEKALRTALDKATASGNQRWVAMANANLGAVYGGMGQLEKA